MSQATSKGQSRTMSGFESIVSVIAGYIITVLIQYFLYPLFGIQIAAKEALLISLIIVLAAFIKNFTVRRFFNSLHVKGTH
jgi:hypothetical protein